MSDYSINYTGIADLDNKLNAINADLKAIAANGDKAAIGSAAGALLDGLTAAMDTLRWKSGGFVYNEELPECVGRFDTLPARIDDLKRAVWAVL